MNDIHVSIFLKFFIFNSETSIDIENPEEFRNDDDGAPQGSDPSWRRKFSEEQTMNLEEIFARQKYTTGKERAEIAKELSLTTKQVKTWFQNRRTKMKRETKRFQFVPVFVPIEQNRVAIPPS